MPILIGVDGGASEVKAHRVIVLERGERPVLALGNASAGALYERVEGFEPEPISAQLADRERGGVRPTEREDEVARGWIDAAARAIESVVEQSGGARAFIGMCMPGLKTRDGRGIEVVRNGPRCPRFLERLEAELERRGVELAAPIPPLASDADACGIGEELAVQGAFRDARNALYIGSGTGLAEVAKLDGRVVGFDALGGVLAKGWELASETGATFEERLSMQAINARFASLAGLTLPLADADLPEHRAARGDPIAIEVLGGVAEALAELAAARIASLRPRALIERVVVGQRLGALCADPALSRVLLQLAEAALARRLAGSDAALRVTALDEAGALRAGYLVASSLREAPAIGAASSALPDLERAEHAPAARER